MSVINTNITSMIGQQNLNASKSALTTSMERLSSGLRINSAKDDAAGQAIANRMSAQITGLSQAQRNANDGISAAQTAEGALNQVNDNLQRIRELTVQAENGTNSQEDLTSIQDEIGQRLSEINRISEQTDFNGVKVLSQNTDLRIQVGANDSETISIELKKIDTTELGMSGFKVSGDKEATSQDLIDDFDATGALTYKVGASDFDVDVSDGSVTFNGGASDGSSAYVGAADENFVDFEDNTAISGAGDYATGLAAAGAGQASGSTITVEGQSWTLTTAADANGNASYSTTIDGEEVTLDITSSTAPAGTNASIGNVDAGNGDGLYVQKDSSAWVTGDGSSGLTIHDKNEAVTEQTLKSEGGALQQSTITVGAQDYSVNEFGGITFSGGTKDGEKAYIKNAGENNASIVAASDADVASRNPLDQIDDALKMVDNQRSELGAVQNRFESAITNLSTTETNISAARSRIEDADYAVEVANMTRAQILQQAGTSVLAQANQVPQSVLSLLG